MAKVSIDGSRVLLTGASSGIGRELAIQLADRGAKLVLVARRRDLLDQVAEQIAGAGGERPTVIAADLSQRGTAVDVAEEAIEALGQVDILVNNAGGGAGGSQWAVGDSGPSRDAIELNYWTPLALIGRLVPPMRERGRGAVVNVTSVAQITTWWGFGAYAATKAALGTATETLRLELSGTDIHVLEAIPGPVDTAVQGETRLVPGIGRMLDQVPLGSAGEMAKRLIKALEAGRPQVIYPKRAAFAYFLPGLIRRRNRRLAAKVARETDESVMDAFLSLVVRTGSQGDELASQAREEWERSRGR